MVQELERKGDERGEIVDEEELRTSVCQELVSSFVRSFGCVRKVRDKAGKDSEQICKYESSEAAEEERPAPCADVKFEDRVLHKVDSFLVCSFACARPVRDVAPMDIEEIDTWKHRQMQWRRRRSGLHILIARN